MSRRVLICGGRDYHDRERMDAELAHRLAIGDVVVHGGAPGADALAGDIAGRVLGLDVEVHSAEWKRYGRRAGPIRNQEMLGSGIDAAIAFPGGRGTADMIRRLREAGIPVVTIETVVP